MAELGNKSSFGNRLVTTKNVLSLIYSLHDAQGSEKFAERKELSKRLSTSLSIVWYSIVVVGSYVSVTQMITIFRDMSEISPPPC